MSSKYNGGSKSKMIFREPFVPKLLKNFILESSDRRESSRTNGAPENFYF